MIRNYLKTAWRNLWKGRIYNGMNIVGLSVAIACCILLFLAVYFEFSFDRFHKNIDHIYQFYFTANRASGVEYDSAMPVPLAPAVKADYQDIKYITRMSNGGTRVKYGEKSVDQSVHFVDEDFFKMFTFPVLKGTTARPLRELNNVVITEYSAKAIFGDVDPIGKNIELTFSNQVQSFVVTAVVKNFPDNSSINFDMLLRFETQPTYHEHTTQWQSMNHSVFVQLNEETDVPAFENRLQSFVKKYFSENINNIKRDGAAANAHGQVYTLNITPFSNNHFNTKLGSVEGSPISSTYIISLLVIGIFILLIACINFINLSVARSYTRAREVGVRKTLGASKWQLLTQFWVETALICVAALMVGSFIAYLILPGFKATFRSNITMAMLLQPMQLLVAFGIFILLTFAAGFYPAMLMLRYKTVMVLKGSVNAVKPGKVRNTLLVVQFAISTLLIVCTLITWQQIKFMQSKPLGYNKSEVISIPLGKTMQGAEALKLFRNQVANNADILSVTGAYDNLGKGIDGGSRTSVSGFNFKGHELRTNIQKVDFDFLKTLDIKLIDGRDFSAAYATDSSAILVNETMARQIGGHKVAGTFLPMDDAHPSLVIGVFKDYNFRSLRDNILPLTLVMDKHYPINYIFVKVKPGNLVQSFDKLKTVWHATFPDTEFRGSWLNENTEKQYAKEKRLSQIFISSAIIAILISCIGLIAISFMIMLQRTKEIGIRKVLGASVSGIVMLLSRDFIKLVLVAAVISCPIAWYLMHNWLESFAYRISIEWWTFVLSTALSVVVAFLTISFQSVRAALANPVSSLKSE